jgi:hypothetical protein
MLCSDAFSLQRRDLILSVTGLGDLYNYWWLLPSLHLRVWGVRLGMVVLFDTESWRKRICCVQNWAFDRSKFRDSRMQIYPATHLTRCYFQLSLDETFGGGARGVSARSLKATHRRKMGLLHGVQFVPYQCYHAISCSICLIEAFPAFRSQLFCSFPMNLFCKLLQGDFYRKMKWLISKI